MSVSEATWSQTACILCECNCGIEVRGGAEAIALPTPLIRVQPERIVSWGLEPGRSARTVA